LSKSQRRGMLNPFRVRGKLGVAGSEDSFIAVWHTLYTVRQHPPRIRRVDVVAVSLCDPWRSEIVAEAALFSADMPVYFSDPFVAILSTFKCINESHNDQEGQRGSRGGNPRSGLPGLGGITDRCFTGAYPGTTTTTTVGDTHYNIYVLGLCIRYSSVTYSHD
jgi:hypothetical protein